MRHRLHLDQQSLSEEESVRASPLVNRKINTLTGQRKPRRDRQTTYCTCTLYRSSTCDTLPGIHSTNHQASHPSALIDILRKHLSCRPTGERKCSGFTQGYSFFPCFFWRRLHAWVPGKNKQWKPGRPWFNTGSLSIICAFRDLMLPATYVHVHVSIKLRLRTMCR